MREEYYLVPRLFGSGQHPEKLLYRGDVVQHGVVVDVDDGVEQVVLLADAHGLVDVADKNWFSPLYTVTLA